MDRAADELALQVVQCGVERRAGGVFARGEPVEHLFERERVVAERLRVLLHIGQRRLRRLAVVLVRRRLAVAVHAAVRQLNVDDLLRVDGAARDDEGLGELERDDPRLGLHAREANSGAAASSAPRGSAARTSVRAAAR